ncbi:Protein of unknown function [Cotesia congregata]|uniref:Uncharacterized protein n=1 Tax=Cotesia congregata TaxID=51543 RepID=A0A8J2E2I9_COTCN|nr:Protein of unknown function [Cotesia congregata]
MWRDQSSGLRKRVRNSGNDGLSDLIDDKLTWFYNKLQEGIDQYVPVHKCKKDNFPCWFSNELKDKIRLKKAAHARYKKWKSQINYRNFSLLRSDCKKLSLMCYKSYVNRIESMIQSDPNCFWKFIKNKRRNNSDIPSNVFWDDLSADTGTDITNLFASYFESVYIPATILPILEYCSVIWSPYTDILTKQLERIQDKLCKYLSNTCWSRANASTSDDLRKHFKLNNLTNRRQVADMAFFYKVVNGIIDAPDICSSFEFAPANIMLRRKRLLKTTKSSKSYVVNGPHDRIVNLVNKLNGEVEFYGGTFSAFMSNIKRQLLMYT